MPRIRYSLFPRGLYLNQTDTLAPEGSALRFRNCAYTGSQGFVRSAPPNRLLGGTGPNNARSRTKFNGRFYNRGEVAAVQRLERETAVGGGAYANLTFPPADTKPSVTVRSSSNPMLFVRAQPTPEKDEFLFGLDTPNTAGDNALIKINDAGTVTHWGIIPPTAAEVGSAGNITATKVAQQTKYINTAATDPLDDTSGDGVATVDWVLSSGDEDALTADSASLSQTSAAGSPVAPGSSKSVKFRVEKDAVGQITRTFGAPIDLTTFGATASSDADFIQFWVRVRRAKHIQSLEIQFDTSDGTFKTAVFSREVNFQLVRGRKRRKLIALGDLVLQKDLQKYLQDQSDKTLDYSFTEEQGKQRIPIAKNAWARVTLPKTTFNGDGSPNWSTVRAIRFVLHTNKEGRGVVWLDELQLVGGAGLHGDYEYTITYSSEAGTPASAGSRSNPAIDDDKGTVTGLRNQLVTFKVSEVERQAVLINFVAGLSFDPQVTRLEIWRTVGNGHAFFRCGYITITVAGTLAAGTTFTDSCADYYGLNSNAAQSVVGNNTNFAVLDPTTELPLDNTSPNDPAFAFQDVADQPHLGRMWWGRNVAANLNETGGTTSSLGNQGLIYYSPPGRLEAVEGFVYITSGITDPVQKLIVWNDRLFCLTSSSLYEIVGTDEPFVAQKIEGAPGTLFPYSVVASPIGILYVASDGVYKFNGQYAENVSDAAMMPIFRFRQSIAELTVATNAALRAVAGRNTYYLGPNFANFTLAYDFYLGVWRYLDAISTVTSNSGALYFDPQTGQIFMDSTAGGADNTELEPQTYPTTGTFTFFILEPLPYFRSGPGKQAILRKLWIDVTRANNGASGTITPTITIDETSTALATFTIAVDDAHTVQEYNLNLPGERFGIRVQIAGARDCRFNAIEMDIYVPGETDEAQP